MPEPVQVQKI